MGAKVMRCFGCFLLVIYVFQCLVSPKVWFSSARARGESEEHHQGCSASPRHCGCQKSWVSCGCFMHKSRTWDPVSESSSSSQRVGAALAKRWLSTSRHIELGAHFQSKLYIFFSPYHACAHVWGCQGRDWQYLHNIWLKKGPLRWLSKMLLTPGKD